MNILYARYIVCLIYRRKMDAFANNWWKNY